MPTDAAQRAHPVAARAAAVGPWLTASLAAICGGVAWLFNPVIGGVSVAVGLVVAAGLAFAAARIRRVTRWTIRSGVVALAALPVALLSVSLAIAASRLDPWARVWAALALAVMAAVRWQRAVTHSDAGWRAKSWANEHEVLDLASGTYDLGRHFQYDDPDRSRSAMLLDRWAPAIGPLVVAFFAGAGRRGLGDVREIFLLWAGPIVALLFVPYVARGVVSYRKVREYERRIGREILNR